MPIDTCEICGIHCNLITYKHCKKCYKLIDRIINFKRYSKQDKIWRKNNPNKTYKYTKLKYSSSEKRRKLRRKDSKVLRQNNKIHIKARNYVNRYNFRRPYCLLCLLEEKETSAYAFHHTDYKSNLGFSICREHHVIADRWLK